MTPNPKERVGGKTPLTHAVLVSIAAKWLAGSQRCALVLEEAQCWSVNEFPDAIGWHTDGRSILVECKMTRSDFHADKRKTCRRTGAETMGRERYYLTPVGLLSAADMPEGYGLLETRGSRVWKIRPANIDERPGRIAAELPLVIHAARKEAWDAGHQGRNVRLTCEPTPPGNEGGE